MSRKQSNPANYNKPFPAALRALMEDRNISQKDLADLLGKTRQAVSLYCIGESAPDLEALVKIAQFFNTSTDYLLGLTHDPSRQPSAIDTLGLHPKAIDNLKCYCSEDNTTGFIDGINILLTLPRISILAQNVNQLSRNITLEMERLKHYATDKQHDRESIYSSGTQMDIQDSEFSQKLITIIENQYPEYKGRIEVHCGRATIQNQMQDVVELFRSDIEIATKYLDCLVNPLDSI